MGKHYFGIFWLLIWKNYKIQLRHVARTILEFLMPILLVYMVVSNRKLTPAKEKGPVSYNSFDPGTSPALMTTYIISTIVKKTLLIAHYVISKTNIFWSPCNNQGVKDIMETVVKQYHFEGKCYDDAEALDTGVLADENTTFGAVSFEDSLIGNSDIGEKIIITIRLPSGKDSKNDWHTGDVSSPRLTAGPKDSDNHYGSSMPDYFGLGFITLQHDIAITVIKHKMNSTGNMTGNDSFLPAVQMNRFPHPKWIDKPLERDTRIMSGFIIVLSFMGTYIAAINDMTMEKQTQLKETMKVMGVSNWLQWSAWFVKICICMIIITILILLLLASPWPAGKGNQPIYHSNLVVVLILFLLYICATATFALMVTTFFKKASLVVHLGTLLWLVSVVPYIILFVRAEVPSFNAVAMMLGSNSAFCIGMHVTMMFEETGEGLSVHNICRSVIPGYSITMGHVFLMLTIDAIIYLLIALYVDAVFPGEYGIPRKWNFFCKKTYWRPQTTASVSPSRENSKSDPAFEPEPANLEVGIAIKNVKKVFAHNTAVDGLNLNIYRGQITVLLGHNGAGKSTTMTMVVGTLPPTNGVIIVNGYTIPEEVSKARSSLGWCPQQNTLFEELTVSEHLYFFSRLKGLSKADTKEEIEKYLQLLDLTDKRKKRITTLSGGMKRKLCTALALCGNSKVCLFDEPSAGVDPGARRDLWDIIQSEKEGRTILLTTHYMDEADVLGDRIAIMVAGKVHCCGSTFFLKKKFGSGYKLIIDKGPKCNVNGISELLQKYIPTIKVRSNDASELSYLLPEDKVEVFEDMLKELENKSNDLGIKSYGITVTSMEEVFLNVGKVDDSKEPSETVSKWERFSGTQLRLNQLRAMLMKKYLCSRRSKFLIYQLIIVLLCMCLLFIGSRNNAGNPPPLLFSLNMYKSPLIMMTTDDIHNTDYAIYRKMLQEEHVTFLDWQTADFHSQMMKYIEDNPLEWKWYALFGATFKNGTITTWFNPEDYHTIAVALQYTCNVILRAQLDCTHCEIQFKNHPLQNAASTKVADKSDKKGALIALLAVALILATSFFIFYYIRERVTKSMHLQNCSGVNIGIYWITCYFWDFVTYLLILTVIIIILPIVRIDGFSTFPQIGRVILLMLLFGLAILAEMHLLSFIFKSAEDGIVKTFIINYFFGPFACNIIGSFVLPLLEPNAVYHVKNVCMVLYIFPPFALASALFQLGQKHFENRVCEELSENIASSGAPVSACQVLPSCCDINEDYLGWEPRGIGKQLIMLTLFAIVCIIINILNEYHVIRMLIYKLNIKKKSEASEIEDDDVLEENRKIRNGEVTPDDCHVLLKDVSKRYNRFTAVNKVCLAVKSFECFGLLGVNGAGKTTIFGMISGDLSISSGDCWIYTYSIKRHPTKALLYIGYCPQFDALLDELTGYETLVMYALVTGIPYNNCKYVAYVMSKQFDFYEHLMKPVKFYSGGNKRKLSTAIALIGDPPIVFLDEPTSGLDPGARRKIWNYLNNERDNGKCLILTSHSMEECESFCTRIAIMVNGVFKCLGSAQHLKTKFSQGHVLTIKMKATPITTRDEDKRNIQDYVRQNFANANLKEDHFGLLVFYVPSKSVNWSKMFGLLEKAKKTLNVEDYSISQSGLEEVFLLLTKSQEVE